MNSVHCVRMSVLDASIRTDIVNTTQVQNQHSGSCRLGTPWADATHILHRYLDSIHSPDENTDGAADGDALGLLVGPVDSGLVGLAVGDAEGLMLGTPEGTDEGPRVGHNVGRLVGIDVGPAEGTDAIIDIFDICVCSR